MVKKGAKLVEAAGDSPPVRGVSEIRRKLELLPSRELRPCVCTAATTIAADRTSSKPECSRCFFEIVSIAYLLINAVD